jgi:hypothetical protein
LTTLTDLYLQDWNSWNRKLKQEKIKRYLFLTISGAAAAGTSYIMYKDEFQLGEFGTALLVGSGIGLLLNFTWDVFVRSSKDHRAVKVLTE